MPVYQHEGKDAEDPLGEESVAKRSDQGYCTVLVRSGVFMHEKQATVVSFFKLDLEVSN